MSELIAKKNSEQRPKVKPPASARADMLMELLAEAKEAPPAPGTRTFFSIYFVCDARFLLGVGAGLKLPD